MRRGLTRMFLGVCLILLQAPLSLAQFPNSVICQFERVATAEPDSGGKLVVGGEGSTGEIVISNLNSDQPIGSGNVASAKLRVLKRSVDTIWLAEISDREVPGFITLFLKSGIVMYTKHEMLVGKPFGFVEIGRFRPLK